jgi:hypothetical protein
MTILEEKGPSTASYAGASEGDDGHYKAHEYGNEVRPTCTCFS